MIGAGIAGLTVANGLTQAGVECVVVEARTRIGGRLHTVDLAGCAIDLGGSWIHHPVGNPMRVFAEHVGVACSGGDPLPQLGGFDCAEGRWLSAAEVRASLDMSFEDFQTAVEQLGIELGPLASAAEAIDRFVDRSGFAPGEARRARQGLRAFVEAEAADLAERTSLQWMWNEIEYGGEYFGDVPVGGYRGLVAAMATGVNVRLGYEVAEVVVADEVVRVRAADDRIEEGSHAVVAMPLGVLQRGVLQFSPSLPPDRLAALQRLGFGHLEKIALRFDRPFWRDAGLSHTMLFPRDPDEPTVWVFDQDAFGAGPALVALVFHSAAHHVLEATEGEAVQWLVSMLADALGGSCPEPTAVAVTSWGSDPYAGGAYTHFLPGATPADVDLLGEPINGRLLFAGEHTNSARMSYADGALTSGIREAKRLLHQPQVRLGPIPAASS